MILRPNKNRRSSNIAKHEYGTDLRFLDFNSLPKLFIRDLDSEKNPIYLTGHLIS